MDKTEKKQIKANVKAMKKAAKSSQEKVVIESKSNVPSSAVRFAESVKGIIYLILSISLFVAIILGQRGMIITLDDIIGSLILATTGKVILIVIAAALLIYGLKQLRLVK